MGSGWNLSSPDVLALAESVTERVFWRILNVSWKLGVLYECCQSLLVSSSFTRACLVKALLFHTEAAFPVLNVL